MRSGGNSGFLSSYDGILGNLISYIKGVKLPFEFGEDTWDCS